MAKRPVVLKFVLGKGLVKRRRESADTARFIAEQVTINYAERTFTESMNALKRAIEKDVRAELDHLLKQLNKFVIGLPGTQSKPRGRLTTVAKSAQGNPSMNLGSAISSWPARGRRYLLKKREKMGHTKWFVGGEGSVARAFVDGGDVGGQTLFEEIFGPVSVTIRRNLKQWGANGGSFRTGAKSRGKGGRRVRTFEDEGLIAGTQAKYGKPGDRSKTHIQMQLATVSVKALGSLNPGAITRESLYGPGGPVENWNQDVATKLAGRANTYRPTLEPFLDFFFEKSLAHAVSERISRGTLASSLLRGKKT